MTPAMPLLLLGLVDAAFSGFRAYAGTDARIRKQRATTRAALRGLAVGAVLLLAPTLTAVLLLLTTNDQARTYSTLTAAWPRLPAPADRLRRRRTALARRLLRPAVPRQHPRRGRRPRPADPAAPARHRRRLPRRGPQRRWRVRPSDRDDRRRRRTVRRACGTPTLVPPHAIEKSYDAVRPDGGTSLAQSVARARGLHAARPMTPPDGVGSPHTPGAPGPHDLRRRGQVADVGVAVGVERLRPRRRAVA